MCSSNSVNVCHRRSLLYCFLSLRALDSYSRPDPEAAPVFSSNSPHSLSTRWLEITQITQYLLSGSLNRNTLGDTSAKWCLIVASNKCTIKIFNFEFIKMLYLCLPSPFHFLQVANLWGYLGTGLANISLKIVTNHRAIAIAFTAVNFMWKNTDTVQSKCVCEW